ncbi:MAG: CoA pyrophosphatase, partial [Desulfobacterales bacterium]
MVLKKVDRLLHQPVDLTQHIICRLDALNSCQAIFNLEKVDWQAISAVLFLLGRYPGKGRFSDQPCLILNKRSAKVRQPGDLCCPGGRISPRLDAGLAALLRLPMSPLARWPYWQQWRQQRPQQAEWLRLLLATGLRESREEMRLNPFGLKFLGPMAAQPLVMFNRIIYPMTVWVSGQKRFYPNWEVEKIVCIPLRKLFDPANYARYRLQIHNSSTGDILNAFPCFRYEKAGEAEILWGATYRIAIGF